MSESVSFEARLQQRSELAEMELLKYNHDLRKSSFFCVIDTYIYKDPLH